MSLRIAFRPAPFDAITPKSSTRHASAISTFNGARVIDDEHMLHMNAFNHFSILQQLTANQLRRTTLVDIR